MKVISIKKFYADFKSYTGIVINNYDFFIFYKNGFFHCKNGPATEYLNGSKGWYYKGRFYGYDNDFTIKSWKEKIKQLKHEKKLKIFL